jgi:lipopolysaccharide export LptBFGC system permease protein LptF
MENNKNESISPKSTYRKISRPLIFMIMGVYIFVVSSQHAEKLASIILKVIAVIGIVYFGIALLKGLKILKSNDRTQ